MPGDEILIPIVVLTKLLKIKLLSSVPTLLYIQVFHSYFALD